MAAKSRPVAVNPETPGAFAELLPDVTPLPAANRALVERELPAPIPEQRLRDEQQALADSLSDEDAWEAGLETGEELQFLRDNLSRDVLRKLRRGHWKIQRQIDLHGCTVAEAAPLLSAFLNCDFMEPMPSPVPACIWADTPAARSACRVRMATGKAAASGMMA